MRQPGGQRVFGIEDVLLALLLLLPLLLLLTLLLVLLLLLLVLCGLLLPLPSPADASVAGAEATGPRAPEPARHQSGETRDVGDTWAVDCGTGACVSSSARLVFPGFIEGVRSIFEHATNAN